MIKTKAQAKRIAKEWQEYYVEFYKHWGDKVETIVNGSSIEIKDKAQAGVYYYADSVAEFCAGRHLSWYIDTDKDGYLLARIY